MAQVSLIEGIVRDAKTNEALPYASIFINQTTKGAVSDTKGYFRIEDIPFGTIEVICTYVGYQPSSSMIEVRSDMNSLEIRLQPSIAELKVVSVTGTRDVVWEQNLKRFKEIFLGKGDNSKKCLILNPWVLEFKEEKTKDGARLLADAAMPLEIENIALGYHITYRLKHFESDAETCTIAGQSQFKAKETSDSVLAKTWSANRAKTFFGSVRHLLRSLKTGRASNEGFRLYYKRTPPPYNIQGGFSQQIGKTVFPYQPAKKAVAEIAAGTYWIVLDAPVLEVHYTRAQADQPTYPDVGHLVSWLEVKGGKLLINENGVAMNPSNLVIYGAMNQTRIADLLPDDYSPLKPDERPQMPANTKKTLAGLQEKVYIHTDKPYYFPGEVIRMKAYMNYRLPLLRDSLSKVLHVELISNDGKVTTSKNLRIANGTAFGEMLLQQQASGDFFLRAYTEWMLNYSDRDIFIKYLPVVPIDKKPIAMPEQLPAVNRVAFRTEKSIYHPRERIDATISISDDENVPTGGNFSVAVTDLSQVISGPDDSILSNWQFQSPDTILKVKFPLETGITLSGICKTKKGKSVAESFLLVRDNIKESVVVDSNLDGHFQVNGLQIDDTVTFLVRPFGSKKKDSHVEILPRSIPPFIRPKHNQLSLKADTTTKRAVIRGLAKTMLLKEVVVTEKRIDTQSTKKEYANFLVDGKTLASLNPNSIVYSIMARFPFIRVNTVYEDGLVPVQRVSINSNYSYGFANIPEPLLFINGLQVNLNGEPIYNILLAISPTQVDRVEINKQSSGSSYSPTFGYRGSISIFLKSDVDSKRFEQKSNATKSFQSIKVEGYQNVSGFGGPDYSAEAYGSSPDYRNMLYWNPQIATTKAAPVATVSFFASDLKTRYRVEIEGVTDIGKPFKSIFFIDIESK